MTNPRRLVALVGALLLLASAVPTARAMPRLQQGVAPTYTVWATREGLVGQRTANGHVIQPRDRFVALPSWRSLASKGGYEFQVRVTYKGRSVVLPVWDVGPWNTHDDYWSPERERYRDLPQGVPMAQAAKLEGYNGGRDEFGRTIRDPNGIDIADGAFWDDLGMTRTDRVQVSFLWMGSDPGAGAAAEAPAPRAPGPAAPAPAPAPAPVPAVALPEGGTPVDNGGAGYAANEATWYPESCGVGGTHVWTYGTTDPSKGENQASWTPTLPGPGYYEVLAYIPSCGRTQASASARYRVQYDGAASEVTLNQQAAAGNWASLGVYRFGGQAGQGVSLSDVAGDNRRAVRFDALAWVARTDTTPPDARVSAITRQDNGYLVAWSGTDDLSGIANYDVQVRQLPDGIWRDWQAQTPNTNAWFGPDEGKHFAFRARARDAVGNIQPWREQADMSTQ